jgi:hypothetical protein
MKEEAKSKALEMKKREVETDNKCKNCGSKKHTTKMCNSAPSKEKGDEREGKEEEEEEDE